MMCFCEELDYIELLMSIFDLTDAAPLARVNLVAEAAR
jgi:hypothetical protein